MDQLVKNGKVSRGYMGVSHSDLAGSRSAIRTQERSGRYCRRCDARQTRREGGLEIGDVI